MSILDKESLNQLYRYAMALTANKADAEDVLQTSIERYLKNCKLTLSDNLPLARKIMRNYWFDELRKLKVREGYADKVQQEHESISMLDNSLEDVCISEHDLSKIWTTLTDSQRELLYMHGVLNYTAQEIAQEQNQPRGSVLSRIHRLKKMLKISMSDSTENKSMAGENKYE